LVFSKTSVITGPHCLDVEEKVLGLSPDGPKVSFSTFPEVSLRTLLEAPDIAATLGNHRDGARRPTAKRE
jgi:hypothetical protein